MKVVDKDRIRKVLKETVLALCQTGMEFSAELCVEGLLGITLDQKDIILVNINEVVRSDVPRDLSIAKKSSEKRKAESDVINNNIVNSLYSSNHTPSNLSNKKQRYLDNEFMHGGYQDYPAINSEDSVDSVRGTGTLRMPIITPDSGFPQFPFRNRSKQISNVAEKHSEISRILGIANSQRKNIAYSFDGSSLPSDVLKHQVKEEMFDYRRLTFDGVEENDVITIPDVENKSPTEDFTATERPFSRRNQEHSQDFVAAQQIRAAQFFNSFLHSGDSSLPCPVSSANIDLPGYSASSQSFNSNNNSQPQPIGLVVDTNVQPPAPLAVVAGTGMLKQVPTTPTSSSIFEQKKMLNNLQTATPKKNENVGSAMKDSYVSPGSAMTKPENRAMPGNSNCANRGSKEFRRFRCTLCPASSSRKFNLQRHMKSHHPGFDETYIMDLTPKERGGQCLKVSSEKVSPQNVGFLTNQSNASFISDDLSNNSDMAMDLSTQFGIDDQVFDSLPEADPCPTSISNTTAAKAKLDLLSQCNFNSGTENISVNDTLGMESNKTPMSKGKIIARLGRSDYKEGTRSRMGLDQVLFSKFGCYTDTGNGFSKPNNVQCSNELPKAYSPMSGSNKEDRTMASTPVIGKEDMKHQELESEPKLNDSVTPIVIIPTTVDEEVETEQQTKLLKPDLIGEVTAEIHRDKGPIANKLNQIVLEDSHSKEIQENEKNKNRLSNKQDQKTTSEEDLIPVDIVKCHTGHILGPEGIEEEECDADKVNDSKSEKNEIEHSYGEEKKEKCDNLKICTSESKNHLSEGEITKPVFDYIFSSSSDQHVVHSPPHDHCHIHQTLSNNEVETNDEKSKIKNREVSGDSLFQCEVNLPNLGTEHNLNSINDKEIDCDDTDTVDGDHDEDNSKIEDDDNLKDNIDTKVDDKIECGDNSMNQNDENDNEETSLKLKVLRSVKNKSNDLGHKTRISPRDSMKLRTRSRSGSKSTCT